MSKDSADQQAATKADLKTFAEQIVTQLRGEMQTMEKGLRGEIQGVDKGLRGEIQAVEKGLRSEMDAQEEKIVARIRDELDSKLAATTYELKRHTEDVIADHSGEVLEAIASVVEPLQTEVQRHALILDN